ncbi:MAG: esterase/lipase family protein [Roseateles sp.]|uniref:esterase/lipase family protein n=1 Tax=Roseateles sp. TaxID=1971397 RepID=UPI0040364190
MDVVLVHGIFNNGNIFRRMVRALEADGHRCWVPSLKPADGRKGIHDLACKLKAYIDAHVEPDAPIAIVGFSMGCIIARQYLQVLGGIARAQALFAIAGPHEGTMTAYAYPGRGARDMRPRSPLLENLRKTENCLDGLKLFTYWTSLDLTILPATSSNWRRAASSLDARAWLHRLMPGDAKVCADITRRVCAL